MPPSDSTAKGNSPPSIAAEAARYALMRRLAPSIRHHLVVNLQPIGMICEVLDRRMRAVQPDMTAVRDGAAKINGLARAALDSCIDTVSWLAPDPKARTVMHEGAKECASLLATSLGFRGYALRNEVRPVIGEVSRAALRTLVTAALIHITDHVAAPARLVLRAHDHVAGIGMRLDVEATDGELGFAGEASYRPLGWDDLLALAAAEEVAIERDGLTIVMVFPITDPD